MYGIAAADGSTPPNAPFAVKSIIMALPLGGKGPVVLLASNATRFERRR
jgi:hypothetical protein